jgi:hypothetical protein
MGEKRVDVVQIKKARKCIDRQLNGDFEAIVVTFQGRNVR